MSKRIENDNFQKQDLHDGSLGCSRSDCALRATGVRTRNDGRRSRGTYRRDGFRTDGICREHERNPGHGRFGHGERNHSITKRSVDSPSGDPARAKSRSGEPEQHRPGGTNGSAMQNERRLYGLLARSQTWTWPEQHHVRRGGCGSEILPD